MMMPCHSGTSCSNDEMNAFRLQMRHEMMNLCFVSLVLTLCVRVVT